VIRRSAKIVPIVAATFVVAGSALGYWAATGAGSASATASTGPAALTVSAATPTQSLLPTGSASGDISLTVTNSNSYPVHVAQLSLDTASGSAGFSANAAGCALTFATQNNGGAGWTFGTGSTDVVMTNSMTMGTGAASNCQSRTFTVYVKAS
jgi:hypothetical protein